MSNSLTDAFQEETIGVSHLGQRLRVRFFGQSGRPLRILFVCGQHGDERSIRRTIRSFMDEHAPVVSASIPLLQLAVLADANPDGFAARTRKNAQGVDLNRDHLLLHAPETRAIHGFVRAWRPHVIVDLHNYPARRKHLVDQRLRLGWDVCLDIPTIPAAECYLELAPFAQLFNSLGNVAEKSGFHFGRYGLLGADGSFRHSTPQLGDARNTLALRYEVPTLLVEMRSPSRSDPAHDRLRLRAAMTATLWGICQWTMREANFLMGFELSTHFGTRIPLGFRRRPTRTAATVPVCSLESGELSYLQVDRDKCRTQPRRHRSLPEAYSLAPDKRSWLGLLKSQGFKLQKTIACGDWKIPVDQTGGRLLALILDQHSTCHSRIEADLSMNADRYLPGDTACA